MPKSYQVRFTGRCTDEFNPHEFDCTFGFETKAQAEAFYDFKRDNEEPDMEYFLVERLYEKKKS